MRRFLGAALALAAFWTVGCGSPAPSPPPKVKPPQSGTPRVTKPTVVAPVAGATKPTAAPTATAPVVAAAPTAPPKPTAPPPPPRFEKLTLPSGTALTRDELFYQRGQLPRMFGGTNAFFIALDAEKRISAAYSYKDGKLDGYAMLMYPTGKPLAVGAFEGSNRDGSWWVFDESTHEVYFSQWRNGRRYGLTCLVEGGAPWFVQEWQSDSLKGQYLVRVEEGKYVAVPIDAAGPDAQEKVSQAAALLKSHEDRIRADEQAHKQAFVKWDDTRDDLDRKVKMTRGAASKQEGVQELANKLNDHKRAMSTLVDRWRNLIYQTGL